MSEENLQALIAYRLQRAAETLEEAHLMQTIGHWNKCANHYLPKQMQNSSAIITPIIVLNHLSII